MTKRRPPQKRRIVPLRVAVRNFERDLIRRAIEQMGSISAAARALDVAPTTLKYKCQLYRLRSPWRYDRR
jgi:transcriptional regulator with PAS, ATPase and Fis domain